MSIYLPDAGAESLRSAFAGTTSNAKAFE